MALALDNLAFVLRDENKLDEAESLERQALTLQKKLLPADHSYIATALNNLALVQARRNNLAEAEKTHREALAMRRRLWKDGHLETASSLDNFALLLRSIGVTRLAEAEDFEREALTMRRKFLGDENLAVAASLHNLALILRDQGKLPEAEVSFRDALAMERKLVGNEHPNVAAMLQNTLDVLLRQQKSGDAEALANEIITPSLETKPGAAGLLRARGAARARAARWPEARADFSQAIELEPGNRAAYDALAALLAQAKDLDAYRAHCSRSLARFGSTADPVVAERIAKDCLILPASGVDLAAAWKLADGAAAAGKAGTSSAGTRFIKGLARFRQGRFADAAQELEILLNATGRGGLREVEYATVFAMAKQMSKETDRARASLAKAVELARTNLAHTEGSDLGSEWVESLIGQSLLNEATALIP